MVDQARLISIAAMAGTGILGLVCWRNGIAGTGLLILVPSLIFYQRNAHDAGITAGAYFGMATSPLIDAADNFGLPLPGWVAWILLSLILTSPWVVFWRFRSSAPGFATAVALWFSSTPPFCIVGVASPLVGAASLFPGTGVFGLAAFTLASTALWSSRCRKLAVLAVALASTAANISYGEPRVPDSWAARQLQSAPNEHSRIRELQRALNSRFQVLVFPEGTLASWNDAARAFLNKPIEALAATGRFGVIGTSMRHNDSLNNGTVILGPLGESFLAQRIPVPLAMWRPTDSVRSFRLNLNAAGTAEIASQRAAILICYEQLLVWPILASALEHPRMLIGLSSKRWTSNTTIPTTQELCLRAWARLFGLPLVSAVGS